MKQQEKQVTIRDVTLRIMESVNHKVEEQFSEKWQGKTDMVLGLTIKVVLLKAFEMEAALPQNFEPLKQPILKNFQEEIGAIEELYLEASNRFIQQGLDENQAMNEAKNQIFHAAADAMPQGMVDEIKNLIHTTYGGKC